MRICYILQVSFAPGLRDLPIRRRYGNDTQDTYDVYPYCNGSLAGVLGSSVRHLTKSLHVFMFGFGFEFGLESTFIILDTKVFVTYRLPGVQHLPPFPSLLVHTTDLWDRRTRKMAPGVAEGKDACPDIFNSVT